MSFKKNISPARKEVVVSLMKRIAKRQEVKMLRVNEDSLKFNLDVLKRKIEVKFSFKENELNNKRQAWEHYTGSKSAGFKIGPGVDMRSIEVDASKYFSSLIRGFKLEDRTHLAAKELLDDGVIYEVYRRARQFDKGKGEDFSIKINGELTCSFQTKSSKFSLERHAKKYPSISGFYYRVTNDRKKDIREIKLKLITIIEEAKIGKVVFI